MERLQRNARGRRVPSARRQNAASYSPSARQRAEGESRPAISLAFPHAPSQESRRKAQAKRGYRDPSSRPTSTESPRTKQKGTRQGPASGYSSETPDCATRLPKTIAPARSVKSGRAPANTRAGSCRETPTFPQFRERRYFASSNPRAMNEGKTPCPAMPKPRSKSNREVAAGPTRDTPPRQVPRSRIRAGA